MKEVLACLMQKEGIVAYAPLPYELTRPTRPYLLNRIADFSPRTALLFLVPYYAGEAENLSVYAAARDYHGYMKDLFSRLCPALAETCAPYRFYGYADHAPIDERHAAELAGLGKCGKNGLLFHKTYGSFVFIGGLYTDAPAAAFGFQKTEEAPACCNGCGACQRACPSGILRGEGETCLSAVSQKKAALTSCEEELLLRGGSVWGCDVCQTVCPYNIARIKDGSAYTPIAYFREERIPRLTTEILASMSDEEFAARAFSFRGRAPLVRNLKLLKM